MTLRQYLEDVNPFDYNEYYDAVEIFDLPDGERIVVSDEDEGPNQEGIQ